MLAVNMLSALIGIEEVVLAVAVMVRYAVQERNFIWKLVSSDTKNCALFFAG